MNGPFISDNVDRVEIPENLGSGWVEIKAEMSIEDWEKVEGEQLRVEVVQPKNRQERRLVRSSRSQDEPSGDPSQGKFSPGYIVLLERNIKAWSWDTLLTRENIARLNRPVSDFIVEAIEDRNTPLVRE